MPAGPYVHAARLRHGKANGVADLARGNLVVAEQSGYDGKSRGIGGGPGIVPKRVGIQFEDRTRAGLPASIALRIGAEDFIQHAVVAIDHQNVAVAGTLAAAFDGSIRRNWIWAGIPLVGVLEGERNFGLAARHHHERNADGSALKCSGTKIGYQWLIRADGSDVCERIRIHGQTIDGRVPNDVSGEKGATDDRSE